MNTLVLLLLALLMANLPWLSNRLFFLIPLKQQHKSLAWSLFELVVLYFVIGAIAFYTERAVMGQVAEQNWEFYAVTGSLFLVFALLHGI